MAKNMEPKITEPVKYKAFGVEKTVEQWSKDQHCLVTLELLQARLDKGWTLLHALETPKLLEE